jgi:uncharacterized repeat protein (TIGR03803 family)
MKQIAGGSQANGGRRWDMNDREWKDMRTNLLGRTPALFACAAVLASIGCGDGATSSGGSTSSRNTTYTIGGTLAGLGAGQSVSLQDNGGDTLTLSANGSFSFPMSLDTGSVYVVTAPSHSPGIACSVSNGGGTVGSSDVMGIAVSCALGTERILYSFGASATDGVAPYAGLIMDRAGNLYGTTVDGGANGLYDGTVFKISTDGTETTLYSFGANVTDGWEPGPNADLIMDSAGNLYGTTEYGGANGCGCGTVFKIDAAGTETILHSFGGSPDGGEPYAGLIMDSAGNLYGTTMHGGANGGGTVFKLDAAGTETILYSFGANNTDGLQPLTGLVMDRAGNLYGTTYEGGYGNGTVFKVSAAGTETILYAFGANPDDGYYPNAGLIMDSAENLYGTTVYSIGPGNGTVFEIGASGAETDLYYFGEGFTGGYAAVAVGMLPFGGVTMDGAGNLYGTTLNGGTNDESTGGDGTVYKIAGDGTETVLYSFGASTTDGKGPYAGLIVDSAGNLYGTTVNGGTNGKGTVFVID